MYVIGDIHGQLDKMRNLLQEAELIDEHDQWTGGNKHLLFIGDYVDRGPDGIGVIESVMRWQKEAEDSGGKISALLGNHDVLLLSAYHFGKQKAGGPGGTFHDDWIMNGGEMSDLERLKPDTIAWLSSLPALMLVEDTLFAHADSMLYLHYGKSIEEVNRSFQEVLLGRDPIAWDLILERFSDRLAFLNQPEEINMLLTTYGGKRLIHGHTPLPYMDVENLTKPFTYADGRCINVDGGMYRGGNGFLLRLEGISE